MAKTHQKREAGGPDISRRTTDRRDFAIYVVLLLATLAVYSQVRTYDFVNLDDPDYVSANPHVRAGLNSEGLVWAFTTDRDGNWFPLTWLSHMASWQLFGPRAGLHHLVNVMLHALSTLLLFALLRRMTGCRWRSAFVAGLFALHPLHVESVAWVAERKDVLSGFFWFLTLWGYLRYIEQPKLGRYLLVLIPFCLGLMSKPMIITLPFVLLLLDVWPLRRIALPGSKATGAPKQKARPTPDAKPLRPVLLEKVPLFALSAGMSVVTYFVQQRGGAIPSLEWIPLGTRLGNALISYIAYIAQMFWPTRLAVFYPYPSELPVWKVVGAGLVLVGGSVLALRTVRRLPYLAVGWFWYLGTLVPVIGLVQVGMQSRADRYTYIPLIGIFLLLAWGVADVFQRWPKAKPALAAVPAAACLACLMITSNQIQNWKSSASLFGHALKVTADNYMGHYGMGIVLEGEGRFDEAITAYREAVRLFPGHARAHGCLGGVYLKQGRLDEAVRELTGAIRLDPKTSEDRISLGIALNRLGKEKDAVDQMLEAIRLEPDSAKAHYNLGRLYATTGQIDDAMVQFAIAVRLEPESAENHYNLGTVLATQGKMNEAVAEFAAAIQLRPGYGSAHNNLGSALANLGRIDEAIEEFKKALRLMPNSEEAQRNLEYALSLQGKTTKR
jgi:tetratricopeptide (TPR) repeat protein